ncbi:MAG: SRPBCC family protein [Solirubrobacterales bacterium]
MRINESTVAAAPAETVWHYLADPENYLRFMSGITHWEVVGDKVNGLGARYRILVRVGAAEVGGLVEMVEWNEPFDIAWHSVTGVDHRGRWRIRERGEGRTGIEFRFAYGVVGAGIPGLVTEIAAALTVRRQMRRTLRRLKHEVEHEQRRLETELRRAAREAARA